MRNRAKLSVLAAACVIGCICLVLGVLQLRDALHYRAVRGKAISDFMTRHSQLTSSSDPYSREFIIAGIRKGDSEARVDEFMRGWTSRSGWRVQSDIEGQHIDYEFRYGPPTIDGYLLDANHYLIQERYRVYFDKQNKAFGVRRDLFIANDPRNREDYFDLTDEASAK